MFVRVQKDGQIDVCDADGTRVSSGTILGSDGYLSTGINPEYAERAGISLDGSRRITHESLNMILRAIATQLPGVK
jgi:hypothetical protein